jgi:hypothetical protein
VTEPEARKIFNQKTSLCDVLGLDLRAECLEAGIPSELFDRLLKVDRKLGRAMTACIGKPSLLPLGSAAARTPLVESASVSLGFTCLGQACTGLPMIAWAMVKCDSRNVPYIRIQADHSAAPRITEACDFTVDAHARLLSGTFLSDRDLAEVRGFIRRNLGLLRGYWTGAIDSRSLVETLSRRGALRHPPSALH